MTNDATRANGEAMPATNRRTALAITGAGLVGMLATTTAAKAAHAQDLSGDRIKAALVELKAALAERHPGCSIEVNRVVPEDEGDDHREAILAYAIDPARKRPVAGPTPHGPWDRANRLAHELADALAEGEGGFEGPAGQWYATIHPVGVDTYPVAFGSISAKEWPKRNLTPHWKKVRDEHAAARTALDAACWTVEPVAMEKQGKTVTKAAERRWNKLCRIEERAFSSVCSYQAWGWADAKAKAAYLAPYLSEMQPHDIAALCDAGLGARL